MDHGNVLEKVRRKLRAKNRKLRTEQKYCEWVSDYLRFCRSQPGKLSKEEAVRVFLEYLAVDRNVAYDTQRQALCALRFLYREVYDTELGEVGDFRPSSKPESVPVLYTPAECGAILSKLHDEFWLLGVIMFGAGLRNAEAVRCRIKDFDFGEEQIVIRDPKGHRHRISLFPEILKEPLRRHLERVKRQHDEDLRNGFGEVWLPNALDRKYPNACREFIWQYAFPSRTLSVDPRSGKKRRHHLHERSLQGAVRRAVLAAGVPKPASCHALRRAFATDLMRRGYDIRTIQKLLGHKDLKTTEKYVFPLDDFKRIESPMDFHSRG